MTVFKQGTIDIYHYSFSFIARYGRKEGYTMANKLYTMELVFVNVNTNADSDNFGVSTASKKYAFPVNITLSVNDVALSTALQYEMFSHRIHLYTVMKANESKKKNPDERIINFYDHAIDGMKTFNEQSGVADKLSQEDIASLDIMTYCIDSMSHVGYLNGKRTMRVPVGGLDLIDAFRKYRDGNIKLKELKERVVSFSDGLNNIPFLKNRTMKVTDDEIKEYVDMFTGRSQRKRWNQNGITAQRVTRDKLVEQILLTELKKVFKFEAMPTVKPDKGVVEF